MFFKQKITILLAIISLFSMLISQTVFADTINSNNTINITFIDVKADFWANDAINNMANKGIISGTPDGKFKPNDPLTREQLAKLLTLTFGLDLVTPDQATFSDVSNGLWSFQYIETAKEYLTGYFPVKGKPFFDPKSNATREDVAVALVRAMGLESGDINANSVLGNRFHDADSVSPQLANEVALAVQNKLIEGFPDNTFGPQLTINRASVATLLYRVLKSSYTQASKDVVLNINMPEKTSSDTFRVSGDVTKGAKLLINNKEVMVSNGSFDEAYKLSDGEKTYTFDFKAALPNGRTRTMSKSIVYETTGPKLTVKIPDKTGKPKITVTGKITDESDSNPTLTINDNDVYISYNGDWSKEINLKEGKNKIKVSAKNKFNKVTLIEKEIEFTADIPELTVDNVPDNVSLKTLTLTGRATDANDGKNVKMYINDVLVSNYESFSKEYTLKEGANTFVFKAVNSVGKTSESITKTVNFTVGGPVLTIDNVSENVSLKTLTLTGRATDTNDGKNVKMYINDVLVSNYESFSKEYILKEGANTFVFKAVNSAGKASESITKTVNFTVGGPTLTIDSVPENVSLKTLTLTGRATDTNDGKNVKMYINDVLVSNYDSFSKEYILNEGANTFIFKAVNSAGKTSESITKTVNFTVGSPVLTIDNVPETVSLKTLTLTGRATDTNDGKNVKMYINDVMVSNYDSFSKEYILNVGANTFVFKAVNSFGKQTVITKTVAYTVPQ
jgi:hypothetical protein